MTTATRQIKIGALKVDFPLPDMDLDTNVRELSLHYPMLRGTRVFEEDAVIENGAMTYNVVTPPIKVNG